MNSLKTTETTERKLINVEGSRRPKE